MIDKSKPALYWSASGSEPIPLPFLPFEKRSVSPLQCALALNFVPKKMLIVGAGVIGLELGSVFRRLGAEVEVVELLDRDGPPRDREVSKTIQQILQKQRFQLNL